MMKMYPKFELDQQVKIQCYNYITKGIIINREYHETKFGIQIKYWVDVGGNIFDPWEADLVLAQDLELGIME